MRGIAYDGCSIAFINEDCRVIQSGEPAQEAATLESWLMVLGGRAVTPEDAIDKLGIPSATARDFIKSLWQVFRDFRQEIGFIDESYRIWEGLYGCATNLNKDAVSGVKRTALNLGINLRSKTQVKHFLFALETYLSILLKLLVARVAIQQRLVPYPSLSSMLHPRPSVRFAELEDLVPHLAGVFEQDSFSWFYDAARTDRTIEGRLTELIIKTSEAVDDVDLTGLSRDFLRVFYQRFFDKHTRLALGEFYTPTNLVNETLDAAGYDGSIDKMIADISCGSGTFVIEAIRRAIAKNSHLASHEVLQGITDHILGIDIHPLAVAMARVNYILAISELMSPQTLRLIPEVRIPIFWADSLARLIPEHETGELAAFGVTVDIHIPGLGNFRLPNPREISWDKLFKTLRRLLGTHTGSVDIDEFWERLKQEFTEVKMLRFEDTLRRFVEDVVRRHNEQRDMRWLPLLRNVLSMEQIRAQCDYIVGNPPWVRIHNIEKALRERLSRNYQFYLDAGWETGCNLSGAGRGFARQVDLAMAFVERGLELLKQDGTLAFVITAKIQQALYANALRSHLLSRTKIRKLVDYSLYSKSFFEEATNYPMVIALDKSSPLLEHGEHELDVIIHNVDGHEINYSISQKELSLLRGDPGSPWIIAPPNAIAAFRKMQTRSILLGMKENTKPRMGIKTSLNRVFIVNQIEPTDSAEEVLAVTEGGETIRVDKTLLRPVIKGRNLREWYCETNEYIIWTHDENTGDVYPTLPSRAMKYFGRHSADLENRSDYRDAAPIWTVFRVSPDKLGNKVVWQELAKTMGTSFVPAVCSDALLGTVTPIPLQTAYLIPVVSEQEAYILAGILNSLPARSYFTSFAARARGGYLRHFAWTISLLPLPKILEVLFEDHYMKEGESHQAILADLATTSQKLHQATGDRERKDLEANLNQTVSTIYGLEEEDIKALEDYYHFANRTM